MDNKTEFILSDDGKIIQRQIVETEKILSADALNSLSEGVVRHIEGVFELPEIGPVNCDVNKECARFSFTAPFLPLKAPYQTNGEGVMYPSFSAEGEPVFDLNWTPPKDMVLKMVIEVWKDASMPVGKRSYLGECSLLALDPSKRCYCLPLGNLYDTGKICMGDFNKYHPTASKCVEEAWKQLKAAAWNGDLDENPELTEQLFRFKANNGGFEQLEPQSPWTELADKISPSTLSFVQLV